LGALAMVLGTSVSAESANIFGRIDYYLILLTGVGSFVIGSFGSVGLVVKRLSDENLKAFATPQNYFNYLFTLIVFISGLYVWYFVDPTLSEYRDFWLGLVKLSPAHIELATAIHIILFALFLIYLPFTRSMHYITKFFAYFWVRWDDMPNMRGSKIERKIEKCLNKPVSWSAPHIPSGKKWAEIAAERKIPGETVEKIE
jgi:nitrate reductase gamma subunit